MSNSSISTPCILTTGIIKKSSINAPCILTTAICKESSISTPRILCTVVPRETGNPIDKKLRYVSQSGESGEITLYDSTKGFDNYLSLEVDGATVYAPLGTVDSAKATPIRIEKQDEIYSVLSSF